MVHEVIQTIEPAPEAEEPSPEQIAGAQIMEKLKAIHDSHSDPEIPALKKSVRRAKRLAKRAMAHTPILDEARLQAKTQQVEATYQIFTAQIAEDLQTEDGRPAILHITTERPTWHIITPHTTRYQKLDHLSGRLEFINPGGSLFIIDAEGHEWFVKTFNRDGQPQIELTVEYPK